MGLLRDASHRVSRERQGGDRDSLPGLGDLIVNFEGFGVDLTTPEVRANFLGVLETAAVHDEETDSILSGWASVFSSCAVWVNDDHIDALDEEQTDIVPIAERPFEFMSSALHEYHARDGLAQALGFEVAETVAEWDALGPA